MKLYTRDGTLEDYVVASEPREWHKPAEPIRSPVADQAGLLADPDEACARMCGTAVERAGYSGVIEVEIFNQAILPDQELVVGQPGDAKPQAFITAAKSEDGSISVIYVPEGGKVSLKMNRFSSAMYAEWVDPATGTRTRIGKAEHNGTCEFRVDATSDRVLLLKRKNLSLRTRDLD